MIDGVQSVQTLVIYEDDHSEMMCSITGRVPVANLTWDCPELTTVEAENNTTVSWSKVSGTVNRMMDRTRCNCTAEHYAWLAPQSNTRSVQTPQISVYCK